MSTTTATWGFNVYHEMHHYFCDIQTQYYNSSHICFGMSYIICKDYTQPGNTAGGITALEVNEPISVILTHHFVCDMAERSEN